MRIVDPGHGAGEEAAGLREEDGGRCCWPPGWRCWLGRREMAGSDQGGAGSHWGGPGWGDREKLEAIAEVLAGATSEGWKQSRKTTLEIAIQIKGYQCNFILFSPGRDRS